MTIRHLYTAPDHNYYGRHKKEPLDFPIIEQDTIELVAGSGIVGDRFFNYKPDYKGQVTLFAWETFREISEKFDLPDLEPSAFRRNIIVEGTDLNALIDTEFEIQGLKFHGSCEAAPCYWMDQAVAPGAEDALRGNGGLRAKVLTSGTLQTENAAATAPAS